MILQPSIFIVAPKDLILLISGSSHRRGLITLSIASIGVNTDFPELQLVAR